MDKEFSIFAQNVAYYSEGIIEGGWIDLPQSPENINKYLKEVVKVDYEHEEYEIADIDGIPFPYSSIQWSSVEDINNLAIVYSELSDAQREMVGAYLVYEEEEHYDVDELINLCLQAHDIPYYKYDFKGIEHCKDYTSELKMGYTIAKENGIYDVLKELQVDHYFDFEKYGEEYGINHNYELLDDGYFIEGKSLNLDLYSKEEIQKTINEILEKNSKEKVEFELEEDEPDL